MHEARVVDDGTVGHVHRDSAGTPFAGRAVTDPGFAGDDGRADPGLVAALEAFQCDPAAEGGVLAALTYARVLVPVVAVLGTVDDSGPVRADKSADMAVVTLVGDGGRRALPVFSSAEALARWRGDARPVPVDGRRAALAAGGEGAQALLLDAAGPVPYVLEGRAALEALARGQLAVPAYADDALAAEVSTAVGIPGVDRAYLAAAPGLDAQVELVLTPGADAHDVAGRLADRLRGLTARPLLRGLGLAVLPRGAAAQGRRLR